MEIVYCSKCGKQIPPGGLYKGRYFVVSEEPVCMVCYDRLPENIREGSIQLFVPESNRRRPTATLSPGPERAGTPTEKAASDKPKPGAGKAAYAGLAGAGLVILAAVVIFLLRCA